MYKIIFMKKVILLIFISFLQLSAQDLTKYVNPFIGTGGHGHTYPGASMPFGMVQLSPDTRLTGWDGCGGYHYSDNILYGFSHTHLSGTGVPDYCDILIMPTEGDVTFNNKEYSSTFIHNNESASPGYYSVLLEKYNIFAELTATKRAGFHRYKFPESNSSNIILDLAHRDEVLISTLQIIGNDEIRGLRRSKYWAKDQYVYFSIKFSKPFKKYYVNLNDNILSEIYGEVGGNLIKASLIFDTKKDEEILVKVGISAVSIEGAVNNRDTEIPGWDFEKVRTDAKTEWNKELGKILVEGGTDDQKTIFYTALYHSLLVPNLYTDVDGNFRGMDLKIHKAEGFDNYTVFSLWDTYRAEHPLFTIIDQKRTNDFINTFLAQYEYGGLLPVWELSANETFCMIGYHSVPVIVDAYAKGIRGYDVQKIYDAMKHSSETNLYGLESYRNLGFVNQDKEHESVSKTLEYGYDDWCIAQVSKSLGYNDDFKNYIRRAQSYKNIFDPSTGFMRAKTNGEWYYPFNPYEVNNKYTEANAWQYCFYVPQDVRGLANFMGGKKDFEQKLDELFTADSKMIGMDLTDITGMIGQYAHGNEPSHHMAYLYNYIGAPSKTQFYVHKILSEFYKNDPDGLIGNEDCGQMSAWYVLSAMGFYPVCPGQLQYTIGTPVFDKVTINLENGKQFIIKTENVSNNNFYIQSATLNGKTNNKCYLNHNSIMNGGEIIFNMGSEANTKWGIGDLDVPISSINDELINPVPFIVADSRTFKKYQFIMLKAIDADSKVYYTLDGSEPNMNSSFYQKPIRLDKTTVVKAFANSKDYGRSKTIEGKFIKLPEGRSIKLFSKYSPQYTAGGDDALIDLQLGDKNWRLGQWQGYLGVDFEAIIDLGKIQFVKKIAPRFLEDVRSWICFPTEVKFEISDDGKDFKFAGTKSFDYDIRESKKVEIKSFDITLNKETRFIKIKAMNYGKLPDWHPGAGDPAFIFIDEVVIE
ncbi:MAG: GH92 family glycosyl hydrolase [Ignavibacteriae bacterium]|nr:GH92 family glycosyl hydrolase [Ignavibacteriota bacterium]